MAFAALNPGLCDTVCTHVYMGLHLLVASLQEARWEPPLEELTAHPGLPTQDSDKRKCSSHISISAVSC